MSDPTASGLRRECPRIAIIDYQAAIFFTSWPTPRDRRISGRKPPAPGGCATRAGWRAKWPAEASCPRERRTATGKYRAVDAAAAS
jgi:hypothetical protein